MTDDQFLESYRVSMDNLTDLNDYDMIIIRLLYFVKYYELERRLAIITLLSFVLLILLYNYNSPFATEIFVHFSFSSIVNGIYPLLLTINVFICFIASLVYGSFLTQKKP